MLSSQRQDNLEAALADVMLLGGQHEIRAADCFQREFAEGKSSSLVPVIESLRKSLRSELGLPEIALPSQFNFRLRVKDETEHFSREYGSSFVPGAFVADGANLLHRINSAQKARTGRELTNERQKQLIDAYDRAAGNSFKRVLWVDDNAKWIKHERAMLEAAGVSIVWVPSTARALELLAGNAFNVIISDMGRVEGPQEGFALLDAIRKRGDRTPLIVYSGSDRPDHVRAVLDRGGQGATNDPSRLFELVMNEVSR
ncbi:response regulator [Brevibacterium gallinarum]|uniref:Response regulator n=1 Tax=Brevibacterium gallinarum TaxID=2762220 RepID=A0ABR8WVM2_9MICO|nr:response regulator [Brevibacterium gallinarum]MBD8021136.1 response regulator [Brevibacterium gallinarum]